MNLFKTAASLLLLSNVTYGFVFDLYTNVSAASTFSENAEAYLVADYTGGTESSLMSISNYYGGEQTAGQNYFEVGDIIDRYVVMDASNIETVNPFGGSRLEFLSNEDSISYDTSVLDTYINNFISDFQTEGLVTDIEEDILTEIQARNEHVLAGSDLGLVVVDGGEIFAFSGSDDPDASLFATLGWEVPDSRLGPDDGSWYLAELDTSSNGRVDFDNAYALIGATSLDVIPEPTTFTLSLVGFLALLCRRKR